MYVVIYRLLENSPHHRNKAGEFVSHDFGGDDAILLGLFQTNHDFVYRSECVMMVGLTFDDFA